MIEQNSIDQIIKEYENNKSNYQYFKSFINDVSGNDEYVFKEMNRPEKFINESKWLKKLNELNFSVPELVGTYKNSIIITKRIDAEPISDEDAREHLFNIGKLIAKLHNLPIKENIDWKEYFTNEYSELKHLAAGKIETDIYEVTTKFIEEHIESLNTTKISIIHRDVRPENVLYSNGNYYLLDFESMAVGDSDYDFTRMFNIFNQKEIYQYDDFKNFMDGYRSVNNIRLSIEKWQIYKIFYAFRMYTRILAGIINRHALFEEYLKSVLMLNNDRVTEWLKEYNS